MDRPDLRARLDLLDADGDPRTGMQAVFSWSYRHLSADAARAFRLLGLHPGPELEPYATAALTGTTVPQALQALNVLARAHLIQPAGSGRHGMHDLLRGYARKLSATMDGAHEQHAALTRLLDHYLHAAATAVDTLFPAERHRRPRIPRPDTPVPPLADPAAARAWLDGERPALVTAAGHAAAHGWPAHVTRLAATLDCYLHNGGHYPEALTACSHALDAARRTGDRSAEATALSDIGLVDFEQGRFQRAVNHFRQALALFCAAGDRAGQAHALARTGLAETSLGRRYEHAARHQQEAAAIFRDIGDRFGEARALCQLGWVRKLQGRYQDAVGYVQQALGLSREIGDHQGEAWALAILGDVDLRLSRHQHAAGYLEQSLALFREMGNATGETEVLGILGEVYLSLGRYEQATSNFERVMAASREAGIRALETYAHSCLGEVLVRTGEADRARVHYGTALRLASETRSPLEQAHAHSGLARTYQADDDRVQARHHWQEALTRYSAIGAPEADEIRARLTMIADSGGKSTEEDDGTTASPMISP